MGNQKYRILVVDDEGIIAMDLQLKLRNLGYDVPAIAHSAEQAIEKVTELQPDLVLMDINMGGAMDGIEAAACIGERYGTPVIFLTAYADKATLERAKLAEPYGYIVKPFSETELRVAVEIAVYKSQTTQLLRMRTRQQAAIAEFGQLALSSMPLEALMEDAASRIADTLKVEYCDVLEVLPDEKTLLLRAGVGWREGLVGQATMSSEAASSEAGYTLIASPVIVDELTTETRFKCSPLLHEHAIVSGMSVIIHGSARPFGVLGAYSKTQRTFTQDDVNFLQPIANVISQAIQRKGAEDALRQSHDKLEMRVTERTAALAQTNAELETQVSERQRAETEVRRSRQELQSFIDAMSTLAAKVAPDGTFLIVNKVAFDASGLSREEYMKTNFLDGPWWTFDSEVQARVKHVFGQALSGVPINYDENIFVFGQERMINFSLIPMRDDGGDVEYLIAEARDITELKQTEEALQQAKIEADRANLAKSEFLSRMSHELRTPMNAILGFAQLLEMDELDAEQRQGVEQILKGGRHLLDLINEVLDIARIESEQPLMEIERVPVLEALAGAFDLVQPLALRRNVTLCSNWSAAEGLYVVADKRRFKQVLLNLLSNAVKYNRLGGTATLSSAPAGEGRLRITISDTGIGIPADKITGLFTPFERLGAEHTGVEGTGLGLALSKRLVEAMGGSITARSTPGVGATFEVELPLAAPRPPQIEPQVVGGATPRQLARAGETQIVVLYIEDNLANFGLVQNILRHRPEIKMLAAMQGRLGIELAIEHRPDLILLDIHLPDIDGYEVLRLLRKEPDTREITVIVVSSDVTPPEIERLRAAGADDYLTKPLDLKHIIGVMDARLREQKKTGRKNLLQPVVV
jgi:PAS domain S-box-containing protein